MDNFPPTLALTVVQVYNKKLSFVKYFAQKLAEHRANELTKDAICPIYQHPQESRLADTVLAFNLLIITFECKEMGKTRTGRQYQTLHPPNQQKQSPDLSTM